ncbi:NAD(P)-dependent alcohol dehydrogenase [Quadrisphaera sp. GCM10027208]|uniref:NAD(P)-dependent alcohol dehydrogenase n=1 Tax=Quadrisphaera sp. GCM10027208 TaxID=3273423 RepID=UPI003620FF29|nr:NAD(P)-dependent alcohol dehydrogenase [Kineosporiaceae bacterium SCSIO 59966]
MRALRLESWKSEPKLVEVPDPTPGPGEAVIRVGGAGACHSDLHLMHDFDAGAVPWQPPFTLGHENAGWVHALGEGVAGFEIGQAVAVYGPWGCGRCRRCLAGVETYCENPAEAPAPGGGGGLGADGGMADYMLVPAAERHLLPLPEGLEPAYAAPLTDAGLTPFHAVARSWGKLGPRATCVVIGTGGLGHLAVQIAKQTTGARVIAVDVRDEALEVARSMGADHLVTADAAAADRIRELTGGRGADVVIDCVGNDSTLALGAQTVTVLGDLTIVGIGGGTLPVGFFSVPYEASVQTTYWGSSPELADVLDLAARGLLTPKVTTYSLDDAVQAYHDLAEGKVEGRAVIVP